MKRVSYLIIVILAVLGLWLLLNRKPIAQQPQSTNQPSPNPAPQPQPPVTITPKQVVDPIADASTRVTKKPFGIYITPATSPVQPERFTGFHTGTDFETTPAEQNIDVPFYAICAGKILVKESASGYGGVFVQSCMINNQAVTIIYGHVSLKSITKNVGDTLVQGEKIGNLGHSPDETDGERKHLHLGIHIGTSVNILGYVQKQSDLAGWLDFQKL